jgi:hypothetical protein
VGLMRLRVCGNNARKNKCCELHDLGEFDGAATRPTTFYISVTYTTTIFIQMHTIFQHYLRVVQLFDGECVQGKSQFLGLFLICSIGTILKAEARRPSKGFARNGPWNNVESQVCFPLSSSESESERILNICWI